LTDPLEGNANLEARLPSQVPGDLLYELDGVLYRR